MSDRALVALVAFGGVIALASGASASSPSSTTRPAPSPRPADVPSPGPSSTVIVSVGEAQKTLNALGAKLGTDGLYGPKTSAAWGAAAKKRALDPSFVRVDGKRARVSQDTARKLNALSIGAGAASRSSSPTGTVTLGPITTIKTSPSGQTTRSTDYRGLTAKERAAYDAEEGGGGLSSVDLLSDEQAYALENAQVSNARAQLPGASEADKQRALRAALRARELLSKQGVAPISAARPSNPTVSHDDDDEPAQERGDDAPLAYVSPPTPINLELARREAPTLAKHLKNKGQAGYSRESLRAFQRHAGITVDGIYGALSESALRYFGVPNPPKAFYQPKVGSVVTYTPT